MITDVGEMIVGAYLKLIEECDVVDYNVRPKEGGIEGLAELDVIGFNFEKSTVFLCEVTTHLGGLNYGSYESTVQKIKDKYQRQLSYAKKYLTHFDNKRYMYWSPRVPEGKLTDAFNTINGLEFIINEKYSDRFALLKDEAKKVTKEIGNPFFRMLQIETHLK